MMKFTQAINIVVAGVLVVPAVTLQGGAAGSLRESLDRTLQALETLSGIDQRLQISAPEALEEVLEHTEQPLVVDPADPSARDRLLEALRSDVGHLQADLDLAQRRAAPETSGAGGPQPTPDLELAAVPALTTGLDDDMRALLASRRVRSLIAPPAESEARKPASSAGPLKVAFEGDDFTADPLRLAQAYYRKGLFEQAVAVLEQQGQGSEALYWRARSLEKLGRNAAAIEAYTAVTEQPEGGPLAIRAREDIEFLNWRLEFEQQTRPQQTK